MQISTSLLTGQINSGVSRRLVIILTGLGSVAFGPVLFTYFTGEDFIFIQFAASGKAFYEPSQKLFYRPLPNLLWQLDYTWWGLQAAGYHFTNLLLHLANAGLVGMLALKLSEERLAGVAAGVLFALHPAHVEPVVWLAARPDLLATTFFLLAVTGYLRYIETARVVYYWLSLAAFSAGLFCKEPVAGLVPVMLGWMILRYWPLGAAGWLRPGFKLIPHVGVVVIYLLLRIGVLGGLGGYESQGNDLVYGVWNATLGLWLPLLFPLNVESAGLAPAVGLALSLVAFYGWMIAGRYWPGRNEGSGLALLIMYGTMLPALNAVPVQPNLAQSRLLYLPSTGFCLLLGLAVGRAAKTRAAPLWTIGTSGVIYVLAWGLALWPWVQSGMMVDATFKPLRQGGVVVQAGDTVYYEGLPDSWRGAYAWRNGVGEATALLLAPQAGGFRRTDELLIDYRQTRQGQLWFVRYAGGTNGNLFLTSSYSVDDADRENTSSVMQWDFSTCPSTGWEWEHEQGNFSCEKGTGLLFDTTGKKTTITALSEPVSPGQPISYLELVSYVNYDFVQPQVLAEFFVLGRQGRQLYSYTFDLAANGKSQRYRLNIPPAVGGEGLLRFGIRANKFRSNILWQKIRLGS